MADRQEDLELQDSDAAQIVGGVKKHRNANRSVTDVTASIENISAPKTPNPLHPEPQESYMNPDQ